MMFLTMFLLHCFLLPKRMLQGLELLAGMAWQAAQWLTGSARS